MISEDGRELCIFKDTNNLTDADFERFVDKERQYLSTLKVLRASDEMHVEYVLALEAFEAAE